MQIAEGNFLSDVIFDSIFADMVSARSLRTSLSPIPFNLTPSLYFFSLPHPTHVPDLPPQNRGLSIASPILRAKSPTPIPRIRRASPRHARPRPDGDWSSTNGTTSSRKFEEGDCAGGGGWTRGGGVGGRVGWRRSGRSGTEEVGRVATPFVGQSVSRVPSFTHSLSRPVPLLFNPLIFHSYSHSPKTQLFPTHHEPAQLRRSDDRTRKQGRFRSSSTALFRSSFREPASCCMMLELELERELG